MKPTLLILAAGLGSRYGSMKQMEAFGPSGETIMDYSIYDALNSGFGKVIFVISPAMEEDFANEYLPGLSGKMDADYVVQGVHTIPEDFTVTPERKKPWGTGHAVLVASAKIREPFAVINADDFYGRSAFQLVADFLKNTGEESWLECCVAGYRIGNTLSEYGSVSRGVCDTDSDGYLKEITERTKVFRSDGDIVFLDHQERPHKLPDSTLVSMNLLGFVPGIFQYLDQYFRDFLNEHAMDPKAEFYIPSALSRMMKESLARVRVLETTEKWFGVTYQEDRAHVREMIRHLTDEGIYPHKLWK